MANKSFILVNLEETKSKKLAQVISNETSRKILDLLAKKENTVTETEIAKEMSIPLSTVHYNLKQLKEGGLVTAEEFHYSTKGREVNHYKLANKYIIITPKKVTGITQKLKSILPVGLIALGAAGIIQLVSKYLGSTPPAQPEMIQIAAKSAPLEAAFDEAAAAMMPAAEVTPVIWQNIALWFLLGAAFALLLYVAISAIRKKE